MTSVFEQWHAKGTPVYGGGLAGAINIQNYLANKNIPHRVATNTFDIIGLTALCHPIENSHQKHFNPSCNYTHFMVQWLLRMQELFSIHTHTHIQRNSTI